MAILKIKQLIDDLQTETRKVMTSEVAKAASAGESGSAGSSTTAGNAGTAFSLNAAQMRSFLNRVVGTWGVDNFGTGIGTVGDASSWGVAIKPVLCVINGRTGTAATCKQLNPPSTTQGAATFVKYLISTGFGSSGTITAGAEGATSTAAKLPTCPANHVAIGYVEYAAHSTNVRKWYDAVAGTFSPFTGHVGATSGTATFYDLSGMPFSE